MNVVLDECLPRRLALHLSGHTVTTVQALGAAGLKNGALLQRIAPHCEAFLTVDRAMRYQQNLSTRPFGTIVLLAASNDIVELLPLVPSILVELQTLGHGEVREVGQRPSRRAGQS